MDKLEEKVVRDKLQDLDKDKVIELYLQKCFESDYLNEKLALTEKALELACDACYGYTDDLMTIETRKNYFKTKAKEIMESE